MIYDPRPPHRTSLSRRLAGFHPGLPQRARDSDPIIEKFQLGWNGRRITIPVYDRQGRLVLYKLGKAPEDPTDSPKMLYDPLGVRAELYGWDTLRNEPQFVIVCEGEYDRLVLEARGFPAVTGTGAPASSKKSGPRRSRRSRRSTCATTTMPPAAPAPSASPG